MIYLDSLEKARPVLKALWTENKDIGSVHTLGALHTGHGKVIEISASENDYTVVSIYPNKSQLAPGQVYQYDLERDVQFAFDYGATHVIATTDEEMFYPEYRTYLDQTPHYDRLDGTVVPFMFKGMVTTCLRWMNFVKPTRCYWGFKDIGQTVLVKRAVKDLMVDVEVREVPCIRFRNGLPISSRLLKLEKQGVAEVARVYQAIETGRRLIAGGEDRASVVIDAVRAYLEAMPLEVFHIKYIKLVKPLDFEACERITVPFILHCVISNHKINHFDGIYIDSQEQLQNGAPVLWLDDYSPLEPSTP